MARLSRAEALRLEKAQPMNGSMSRTPNDPRARRGAQAEQDVFSRFNSDDFHMDPFGRIGVRYVDDVIPQYRRKLR
tara:strand:+ start:951 stop:1178 length:228 start_codon:yes stop_codon:yes gene_type:complete